MKLAIHEEKSMDKKTRINQRAVPASVKAKWKIESSRRNNGLLCPGLLYRQCRASMGRKNMGIVQWH
jgi:hypothetical protein